MTQGFTHALETLRSRIKTRFPDEAQAHPFLQALEDLLRTMPKYEYGMTIAVEDGVAIVSRRGSQWGAEFRVNEDGGYVSVTLDEGHLRSIVDFIDRQKAAPNA